MILVIDANILFSALIKNSVAAELLFEEDLMLFTPDFIMDEFLKYEDLLLKKTSRTKEEFIQVMHMLKEVITVVPMEEYSRFIKASEAISPDEKDAIYFALAMKLKCPIWSNDKKLKQQGRVKVYSTSEIMKFV